MLLVVTQYPPLKLLVTPYVVWTAIVIGNLAVSGDV